MEFPIEILRRPYQRSVGVIVRPNGSVRVTAGVTTPKFYINKVLKKHQSWIEKSLNHYQEVRELYPEKKYSYGEEFLFKGEIKSLDFLPTANKRIFVKEEEHKLILNLPEKDTSTSDLKKAMLKFYKKQGSEILTGLVEEESTRMSLYPKKLSFRAQKSRWGSCSTEGNISLNWKLAAAPIEVSRYVVIHELAHLSYQDHSSRFWNLVEQFCPDMTEHKKWIKEYVYAFDFLAEKPELY